MEGVLQFPGASLEWETRKTHIFLTVTLATYTYY